MRFKSTFVIIGFSFFFALAKLSTGLALERNPDIALKVDDYLSRITPFGYSGAFLLAKNGEILLNKGYGMAIRDKGIPSNSETVFCTGSVTKQFTAAGIMKLEMMGKLKTSDPIARYLPDVPPDKETIPLHYLLTHTSGIGSGEGGDYEVVGRDETVKKILAQPLRSEPGKEFFYSNSGYSLLAAIIERVSGQSYEEFLRANLFLPAGMHLTGYVLPDWKDKVIAHWYVGDEDNGTPLDKPFPYWNLLGNGGILSTTEDMFRWNRALKGDAILSAEVKRKLWTPFLNEYAYGWDVMKTKHGMLIQHDGGSTLGSSFDYRWFVDPDILIVLFCNQSPDGSATIFKLRKKIEQLVFGGSVELPPLPSSPGDSQALSNYAGTYRLPAGSDFRVTSAEGALTIEAYGQDAIDFLMGIEGYKERFQALNSQTEKLAAEVQKENYEALHKALGDRVPLERITERQERMRKDQQAMFGPLQKFRIVGTVPFEGDAGTLVEFIFEKGSILAQYIWGKENLEGIRIPASPIKVKFLPQPGAEFLGYDLDLAKVMSVKFTLDERGTVKGMAFKGKSGLVTAPKTSQPIS